MSQPSHVANALPRRRPRVCVPVAATVVAVLAVVVLSAKVSSARGEVLGRWRARAEKPAPNTSTAYAPVIGQPPYFGKALGATYYTWGYFGAQEHYQTWSHMPYYDAYPQWGHRKGY